MALVLERATAAVQYAAMTVDADHRDRTRACHVAKAAAGEAARRILKDGIQVHGGIGYTWEHDLHLYLRRATADEYLLGPTGWHHDRLADLLFA
jgi:alkylation response protein AidB-like acyl-CoA dehydrogenase